MRKYYKILGIETNASIEEIKSARNRLLKKYHPDKFKGGVEIAEQKTFKINEAYDKIVEYLEQQEKITRSEARKRVEKEQSKKKETKSNSESFKKKKEKVAIEKWENNLVKLREKLKNLDDSKEQNAESEIGKRSENNAEIEREKDGNELSKNEKGLKLFLDWTILGLIFLLIVLIILFFTGVIR